MISVDITNLNERSINSRICGHIVEKGEEQFIDTNPSHYNNYWDFIANGGVKGLLREERILSEAYCLGGHIGVIAVAK